MYPRLGLRSRILALTMPIVILVSAATAGIIYISLGQVLEASARDIAASEAGELRTDLAIHTIADLASTHEINVGNRASQMVDPTIPVGELTVKTVDALPGLEEKGFAVAAADAVGSDGRRYTVLVA